MTALDFESADRLAIAVRRQCIELAGAAIGTVAVYELASLDGPLGVRHGASGQECSARPNTGLV
jgi:hypothetical protein